MTAGIKCIVVLGLGLLVTTANGTLQPGPQTSDTSVHLTILHDNDLHGHLESFCYLEKQRSDKTRCDLGGAARRATLINRIRAIRRDDVLLVDAGDTFTRGPLSTTYEGLADIEVMNALGYDVASVGNNEFKAKDGAEKSDARGSKSALLRVVRNSRFPWICANVLDENGSLLQGVQPFVVRRVGQLRIAFLGLTSERSEAYPQTTGWKFIDPISAAQEWVPIARRDADIVVAITHIGRQDDQKLAQHTRGIDVIIGGDSHTFLYAPIFEKNIDGWPVTIVQDGEFGVNLGRLDLDIAKVDSTHWQVTRARDKLLPVKSELPRDPTINKLVKSFEDPLLKPTVLLPNIATSERDRQAQTSMLIAEALVKESGTDIGLHSRDYLYDVLRSKRVSRYDVNQMLPFKQHVLIVERSGSDLTAVVKPSAISCAGSCGSFEPNRLYRVSLFDPNTRALLKLRDSEATDTTRDVRDVVVAFLSSAAKGMKQGVGSDATNVPAAKTPAKKTLRVGVK